MSISHKYFWLFGLGLTLLLDSRHSTTLWNTSSTSKRKTPPRSSLMPLDEIERMEENSDYCQELRGSCQARSAANVRTKAQAEAMRNETTSTRTLQIITSKLATW
ncbi:hypothetical protein BASA81_004998 [Batrachochytrium salamandrivorans]|nr:hypothetical protein BASA81_004998 [Batrachochytrium salamandrivorans]